jgi:hypothetical protein
MASTEVDKKEMTVYRIDAINNHLITEQFISLLRELEAQNFIHKWQLEDELAAKSVY